MNDEERVYTYTQALRKRSAENCAIVESLGPKAVEAFLVGYEQANNQIRKNSMNMTVGAYGAGVMDPALATLKGRGKAAGASMIALGRKTLGLTEKTFRSPRSVLEKEFGRNFITPGGADLFGFRGGEAIRQEVAKGRSAGLSTGLARGKQLGARAIRQEVAKGRSAGLSTGLARGKQLGARAFRDTGASIASGAKIFGRGLKAAAKANPKTALLAGLLGTAGLGAVGYAATRPEPEPVTGMARIRELLGV